MATKCSWNRRELLRAGLSSAAGICAAGCMPPVTAQTQLPKKAQVAITFDLEMSRNFPQWDDMHWEYDKGNLDDATKRYALAAAARVKHHGGRIHFFCVARVLEQPDIAWIQQLAAEGHPIGNHTYDHVNILAAKPSEIQFRFQRAPWLIEGKSVEEVIRENIRLAKLALRQRAGIENRGFRTPGGFASGLKEREDLQRLLLDEGFTWVSSLYPPHSNTSANTQPSPAVYDNIVESQSRSQPFVYPTGLVEIPMSPISDIGAFRNGQWKLEWFLEAIHRSLTWAIEHRAVFDFLAHPSCLGVVDPELKSIDLICDLVRSAGEAAELTDLDRIAASTSG